MNMSDLELRNMTDSCTKKIDIEKIRTKTVCERYVAGNIDFATLLNAVNLADKEIRKQARIQDVLRLVLGDE